MDRPHEVSGTHTQTQVYKGETISPKGLGNAAHSMYKLFETYSKGAGMRQARRVLGQVGVVAAIAIAVVIAVPTVAEAWYEPANTSQSYWSPGPPPGNSNANECYVTTANGVAFGEPFGQMYVLDGYGSYCAEGAIQLYWTVNGNYYVKGIQYLGTNTTSTLAGGAGGGVVAVDYCSWDTTGIEECWEASWLG
jgi:hypothetical protein